jgi:predicted ribosome quality control (RQC) complex YloA/Tae2 family protein
MDRVRAPAATVHNGTMADRRGPPGDTDADNGIWAGRRVARRFESPDGLIVLVGKTAAENDVLTLKLAAPRDFWMHVAAESGSHVVIRNPDNLAALPRETMQFAAGLAAGYSKARRGGRVAVHVARVADVSKPRGLEAGKVLLARYKTVHAQPRRMDEGSES